MDAREAVDPAQETGAESISRATFECIDQ